MKSLATPLLLLIGWGSIVSADVIFLGRLYLTAWPSGLRRWLRAPVRKGVGWNPIAIIYRSVMYYLRGGHATELPQIAASLPSPKYLCQQWVGTMPTPACSTQLQQQVGKHCTGAQVPTASPVHQCSAMRKTHCTPKHRIARAGCTHSIDIHYSWSMAYLLLASSATKCPNRWPLP